MDVEIVKYRGDFDEQFYWARVDRNLGFFGQVEGETEESEQIKLRDLTIGVAGCGGMGGDPVARFIRAGVGSKKGLIKVADPDFFDESNLNRQWACVRELLRKKNKAVATAELAFSISEDCNIDAFPQGIIPETVECFVDGCDFVLDEMEFYQISNRYLLHQECRKRKIPIISGNVVWLGNRIFYFTHDSMTIEEFYDIPQDAKLSEEIIIRLIDRLVPKFPRGISREKAIEWAVKKHKVPILPTSPAQGSGFVTNWVLIKALDWENKMLGFPKLPKMPGFFYFDMGESHGNMFEGKWW